LRQFEVEYSAKDFACRYPAREATTDFSLTFDLNQRRLEDQDRSQPSGAVKLVC